MYVPIIQFFTFHFLLKNAINEIIPAKNVGENTIFALSKSDDMPTNKQAKLRYDCLNKCFQNPNARYTFDDLKNKCSLYINSVLGMDVEISIRTLRDDIAFMKKQGAPIRCYKSAGTPYYRYEDCSYCFNSNEMLSDSELQQLLDTIQILGRFNGMPQFEEVASLLEKLENSFKLDKNRSAIVCFDQNVDVVGKKFFKPLFDAIIAKAAIKVVYKPFADPKEEFTLSPYFLKQYNQRWYVFGSILEHPEWEIANLSLDRISKIKASRSPFVENPGIDFEDYFDDIIGVTRLKGEKVQTIKLKVDPDYAGYFLSRPLHWTQRPKLADDGTTTIKVCYNKELENKLFEMSAEVEVLEPLSLRKKIHDRLVIALEKHKMEE